MNWSMSSRSKYVVLGFCILSVLGLVDGLVGMMMRRGGLGFAVAVWVCYGVVFAWMLVEPMVSAALLGPLRKDWFSMEDACCVAEDVAHALKIDKPTVRVYRGEEFKVMTTGFGKGATIFMTERVAMMDKELLRAIMAHECSHISLRHMELRTLMLGSLLMLALIPNGLSILAMVANFFVLWAVRSMEFKADAQGAAVVGQVLMCEALEDVRGMVGEVPKWSIMFNSHPRFEQRLLNLRVLKVVVS